MLKINATKTEDQLTENTSICFRFHHKFYLGDYSFGLKSLCWASW